MPNLEETIHDLAERGELTHFSLAPGSRGKYRASFAPSSKFGVTFAEDVDPVKALMLAFTTAKMKRKAPTDREIAAAEARSTATIPQETETIEQGVEDLM